MGGFGMGQFWEGSDNVRPLHPEGAPHDEETIERLADHLIAASKIVQSLPDEELRLLLRMSLFRLGHLVAARLPRD